MITKECKVHGIHNDWRFESKGKGQRRPICRPCKNDYQKKQRAFNITEGLKIYKAGDHYVCYDCGFRAYNRKIMDLHHIISRCQNGPDTFENLVMLCPLCHRKRHYPDS